MSKLQVLINELASNIKNQEKINLSISSASIGWHIAHSTLVIKQVTEQIEKSLVENYKWKFNASRFFVLLIQKIPRGKGKAPKSVQVNDDLTIEVLNKYIEVAKGKTFILIDSQPNKHFFHPFFGMLNVKSTIKFLEIHTKHHMTIIGDILKETK